MIGRLEFEELMVRADIEVGKSPHPGAARHPYPLPTSPDTGEETPLRGRGVPGELTLPLPLTWKRGLVGEGLLPVAILVLVATVLSLIVAGPNTMPGDITFGRWVQRLDSVLFDWVAWVGKYEDIIAGREGQYRVRIMDNTKGADCTYPGVELLPDGTFVTTTYGHWAEGEMAYIVSVRFKLEELDAKAKR